MYENGNYRSKKDDRTLFVVGLSWWTKDQGLKDYFGKFGVVEAINIKAGCGFCSVVFKDIFSVDAVMKAGKHMIDGMMVEPKRFKTDRKRKRSRSRSPSPHKRQWRKSSETEMKERVSISSSKYCKTSLYDSLSSNSTFSTPVSSTALSSNIPESASVSSSNLTSHCEASYKGNPILNGLPNGVRSQFDDAQWKSTPHYNHHRTEFDGYHQYPGPHYEYDKKQHYFMQMLEKQKTNAPQREKINLWNQVWKMVLNNSDEEKQTLKKSQKKFDSTPVENKLTTQYNHHQVDYDKYHQDPKPHDECDIKRKSFMKMLEKQKTNAPEKEKINLWNQFWKVVLNNSDEENLSLKKAQKNIDSTPVEKNPSTKNLSSKASNKNVASKRIALIDLKDTVPIEKEPVDIVNTDEENLYLKKAQKNINSIPVEKNPSPKNWPSKASNNNNVASKGITLIDLKEMVPFEKESVDIVDTERIEVKKEKLDPLENIATRMNVKSNIQIENNTELSISIKKEPSFDIDMSNPLNFGSDDQLDPDTFLKDLDMLKTEYVAVGIEQADSGFSNSSRIIMNPDYHDDSSSSSGRMRSPEVHSGDPQEFDFKKERNDNEDYSTSEKEFGGSKSDSFFNVETEKDMVSSGDFPNHLTDNETSETGALDISQKEKQSGNSQEFYFKNGRSAHEDYSTIEKQFGGSKGDLVFNVNTGQDMVGSEGFSNHETAIVTNETFQANVKVKDALHTIKNLSNRLSLFGPPLSSCINTMKNQSTDSVKQFELLQDKHFLLILKEAATKFEKESAKINDEIVKCLSEVDRKQDLDINKNYKSKQSFCIHGMDIEKVAKRTIYKTSEECKQFIVDIIMYETMSSVKPSEAIVKEIFNKVSALHYDMIKGEDNTGKIK